MNYYLYFPHSYKIRSQLKKKSKALGYNFKKTPWQKMWVDLLVQGIIETDISTNIAFLEHQWFKNPVCLMPESLELIEQLFETNFEGQIEALNVISDTFTIALPKEVKFNNQIIKGIFVAYIDYKDRKKIVDRFNDEFNTKVDFEDLDKTNEPQLTLCYEDPDGQGRIVLNVDLSNLKHVLKSENIEEYRRFVGEYKATNSISYDLSPTEQKTQFSILKFIVSFVVYISAHQDSVEFIKNIKIPGSPKQSFSSPMSCVKQFKAKGSVRPHYRNLKHEKYYHGDLEKWAPGSRWIPVNMETAKVKE